MIPYHLLRHTHHLDSDLPAISFEQCHLKVARCVHLDVQGYKTNAALVVASSGSQFSKSRQHATGDGASATLLLFAPRRFSTVSHFSIIAFAKCRYVSYSAVQRKAMLGIISLNFLIIYHLISTMI